MSSSPSVAPDPSAPNPAPPPRPTSADATGPSAPTGSRALRCLGTLTARHRWAVLTVTALLLLAAAITGSTLGDRLSHGGFTNPGAESERAQHLLGEHLIPGGATTIAIFHNGTLTVDDPDFGESVVTALALAPYPPLLGAQHYWNTGKPELLSTDRHSATVILALDGPDDNAQAHSYQRLRQSLHADGFTITYTGRTPFYTDLDRAVDQDLTRAELLVFPALFILLLLFFRSLTAALLPLAVAGASLALTRAVLLALTHLMPVSSITRNVVVMIALGLSVDYALFMVVRFRRELRRDPDPHRAVAATTATTGHTVLYSAAAISLATLGLLLVPFPVTRSLGIGAAVTVTLAGLTSLTLLPAALAVLGPRINTGPLPLPGGRPPHDPPDTGPWHRLGRAVVSRPKHWLTAAVVIIALLALPATHLRLGASDQHTLPAGIASRAGADTLDRDFPAAAFDRIQVLARLPQNPKTQPGQRALADLLLQLTRQTGPHAVHLRGTARKTALITVTSPGEPDATAARQTVRAIRALNPPPGVDILVGGPAAASVDVTDTLHARTPLLAGYLLLVTFALLFLAFRSIVVPLKAVITTTMSLGIAFAAVTWTIQDGHGARLLGFSPTGYIGALEACVMLMFVFALSIDYELFLIAHIRELHQQGFDNERAIVTGLGRTGGLISAAATLIILVAAAFATSPVITVKEIALGVLVAVAVDATLVRTVLVPASLRLLGELNWWTPTFRNRRAARPQLARHTA